MKTEKIDVTIQIEEEDDEPDVEGYTFNCPICKKGLVTLGRIRRIQFDKGILSADKYGDIEFEHYTCDRCSFKILIPWKYVHKIGHIEKHKWDATDNDDWRSKGNSKT